MVWFKPKRSLFDREFEREPQRLTHDWSLVHQLTFTMREFISAAKTDPTRPLDAQQSGDEARKCMKIDLNWQSGLQFKDENGGFFFRL